MLKRVWAVCGVAVVFWTGWALSEEEKKLPTADRHKQRGLACEACHKEANPKTEAPPETCLTCHQSIEAVGEKTVNLKPNPHKNHVTEAMDVDCTHCHRGHKADDPICLRCHMGMVFEKKVPDATAVPAAQEQAPVPLLQSTAAIMTQPMNVFRRFSGDAKGIYDFYGGVLGLKQLTTYNLGGDTNVARFEIGPTQLKLSAVVSGRKYQKGAIQDATGLRLLSFFFPSQTPVAERFRAHGLPVPEFHPIAGSKRSRAFVQDPDGQWVEIVIAPEEAESTYSQVEIGLVVSDLAASRKFYREFIGLEELPPVEDAELRTQKYPYRRGSILVSLRSFGKPLPADTGSGGIQYVVSDVKAVQDLAQARQVKIDQPVNTLSGFGLRFVWLDDPDGITNYYAEIPAAPAKKQ